MIRKITVNGESKALFYNTTPASGSVYNGIEFTLEESDICAVVDIPGTKTFMLFGDSYTVTTSKTSSSLTVTVSGPVGTFSNTSNDSSKYYYFPSKMNKLYLLIYDRGTYKSETKIIYELGFYYNVYKNVNGIIVGSFYDNTSYGANGTKGINYCNAYKNAHDNVIDVKWTGLYTGTNDAPMFYPDISENNVYALTNLWISKGLTISEWPILSSYSIAFTTIHNGTISGPSTSVSGKTVTLTVTPDSGYILSGSPVVYKTASQDGITVTKVNDTTYTFVMPDTDVTVTGVFVRAYTISYGVNPTTAGTISGSLSQARPGQTVTFTVTPDSNFQVSSVSVNAGITDVVWSNTTLTGSFVMPERTTYVTVTLVTKDDPNGQGGTSEPETPEGTFNDNSDSITIPTSPSTGIAYDVPVGQGVGKGILTIYNPSLDELKDLGEYLYANSITDAIWNGLRNIFANPMDAIISLHVLPFTPNRGANKHNIALGPLNSQISSYIVSQQYQDVNMGALRFEPYWDSYLDYSPYTKISLFLPYIGSVELNPDIVMGKLVGIRYRCDVLTGGCVAYLFTYEGEPGSTAESVFGEYSGSMALSLPLSGSDFAQIISGFISAVSSVAIMKGAGTGALVTNANESVEAARKQLASAHAARGEAYAMPKTVRGAGGRFISNMANRQEAINSANSAYDNATQALQMARGQQRGVTALAGATHMATVPYTVGRVMGSKINTTISGTITGGLGLLGTQKPYVIITRPRQSLADNYKHFAGYPSNITAQLNTLSGYTKVEQVELKNVPCTDTELAMLYDALKEGSYI